MPESNQLSFDFEFEPLAGSSSGNASRTTQPGQNSLPTNQASGQLQICQKSTAVPLDYTVHVAPRARRVYLRVVPGRGLVVTIPRRFPKRDVPALVEEQRSWVEEALADLHQKTPVEYREWPPTSLSLAGTGDIVSLTFCPPAPQPTGKPSTRWQSPNNLALHVAADDKVAVAESVAAALKPLARSYLAPRLATLAKLHGFQYKRVTVRGQRTVWGSYSSSGTLSLNYKLLFLRPELVDYVLLHELTHTRYLDHSEAFWNLLEKVQPLARELDNELSGVGTQVPPWLELAR